MKMTNLCGDICYLICKIATFPPLVGLFDSSFNFKNNADQVPYYCNDVNRFIIDANFVQNYDSAALVIGSDHMVPDSYTLPVSAPIVFWKYPKKQ